MVTVPVWTRAVFCRQPFTPPSRLRRVFLPLCRSLSFSDAGNVFSPISRPIDGVWKRGPEGLAAGRGLGSLAPWRNGTVPSGSRGVLGVCVCFVVQLGLLVSPPPSKAE